MVAEVVTVVELADVVVVVSSVSPGEQAARISPSATNLASVVRIGGDDIEAAELVSRLANHAQNLACPRRP